MLITIVPVLLMIIGGLMWAMCVRPKLIEAGRLIFFAGILSFAFAYSSKGIVIGQTADVRTADVRVH